MTSDRPTSRATTCRWRASSWNTREGLAGALAKDAAAQSVADADQEAAARRDSVRGFEEIVELTKSSGTDMECVTPGMNAKTVAWNLSRSAVRSHGASQRIVVALTPCQALAGR